MTPPGSRISEVDGRGGAARSLDDTVDSDSVLRTAMASGRVTQFAFERRRLSEVFREALS